MLTLGDGCYSNPRNYNHHRLCIGRSDPFIKPRPICSRKELPTSQVHSLLWFSNGNNDSQYESARQISWFLGSFKVLTLLDLEGVSLKVFKFPEEILSNIHLKYLALKDSFKCIPPSIAYLWNLETLVVRGYIDDPLPDAMWKMGRLRRVTIGGFSLYLENFEQHDYSYMAAHNIETLGGLILRHDPQTLEFLRRLPRLRKLCCFCEGKELHPMWFSVFGSLENLVELKVLSKGFGGTRFEKLPTFVFSQNLRKLTLKNLRLPWSAMSAIGKQLPNLEVLKLIRMACLGTIWDLKDGEFSKLKFLKLRSLEIEQINVSECDNPFPCLEKLVVEYCAGLKEIPSNFGDICALNTIKLIGCPRKLRVSSRQILEHQQDMGNHSLRVHVKESEEDDDDDGDGDGDSDDDQVYAKECDDDDNDDHGCSWDDGDEGADGGEEAEEDSN